MIELQNFKLLGITLAIGLLIGLERGWHMLDKGEGVRIAGLPFLSLMFVLLIAYSKSLSKFEDYSITSMAASLLTYTLGALTAFGHTTRICNSCGDYAIARF